MHTILAAGRLNNAQGEGLDGRAAGRAVPLAVWYVAAAVVVCTVLAAAVYAAVRPAPHSLKFVEFNRQRVEALRIEAGGGEDLTVLLLGGSALKYATREEGLMAAGLSQRIGRPVRVLRIVNNWAVFSDFDALLPSIRDLRPHLVVMESQLLDLDRPWDRRFLLLTEYLRWLLTRGEPFDYASEDPANVQFALSCWSRGGGRTVDRQLEVRRDWVAEDPHGVGPTAAREFIASMIEAGAGVALVEVPRRPDLERARALPALAGHGRANPEGTVEWRPPPMPQSMYCDVTHVAPLGRLTYSNWLERQIAGLLAHPSRAAAPATSSALAAGPAAGSL